MSALINTSSTTRRNLLRLLAGAPAFVGQIAEGLGQARAHSDLAADERIDFYTTTARLSGDGSKWIVPVHGRVFRPVRSTTRKTLIATALQKGWGVAPDRQSQMRFDDRIDLLLGDNKGGRTIVVEVDGRRVTLPLSGADGHFTGTLELDETDSKVRATLRQVDISAILQPRDPRRFSGTALLIGEVGMSVISDIDDTVKVTHVTDKARMFKATFVDAFEAVPDMARVFRGWAADGAAIHFVSSSPWHLYEPIETFLGQAGFPKASLALKKMRLKDSSILELLADATKTKPREIEALLAAYPKRTFVLVGDSGEKDPEIYADFLRRHPSRFGRVFIRNVTGASADDARIAKVFAGIERNRWQLFSSASELPSSLRS